MGRNFGHLLREHPIPPLALTGLLVGAVLRLGLGQPEAARWVWLGTLILGGAPLAIQTTTGMLRGRFNADIVALLAIIAALGMGEAFAGVIIVLMQSGGEALEAYSLRRASSSLDQLLARAPRVAHRKDDGQLVDIDVSEVRVGDALVVRPGDLVPVDGTLTSERAEVDESALTGEPMTRSKRPGDPLMSGGVNAGDAFEMRAERPAESSQYARIVTLVRQAQEQKAPLQRVADRYAVWFTPLALALSALGWGITGDPRTILAVLVVATPCPLILAVPVAVISGINRAAREGIIVKGGAAIEQVGRARAMVFDKTGTLTFGTPKVERVVSLNETSEEDLLRATGGVEQLSSHLLAQAVAGAARSRLGDLPLPTDFREVPGRGVEAILNGRRVLVGSRRFLTERLGRDWPEQSLNGAMAAHVAIDGQPAGVILFGDRLRPGVPDLMHRLRGLGVRRSVMLTGDGPAQARDIARQAGIDQVEANLLPEDKVLKVRELGRQLAPVVMVGDGINDAPALASATVGIAMGARGTGISAEAADIVLLVDDVTRVGEAVAIGQRMLRIAHQSIFIGLGFSLAFMFIASFGLIPPVVGALLQEALDISVILNALRAR